MSTVGENKSSQDNSSEDFKDQAIKHPLSKFEYDLYHEEEDVSMPVVRIKKINMPNKGEKWKIMSENKVVFVIEGTKLSKKEKEFLRSINGFNFLLAQAKNGIKSLNNLKNEIKKNLKEVKASVAKEKQSASAPPKKQKRRYRRRKA